MTSYKDRVRGDLDRWIGEGLAPAANRQAMLDMIPDSRRPDAAAALAMIGVLLAGAAIIAFVAANWDVIPRFARFAILMAAFLAACAGGAWASWRQRPNASNGLITLATLVFAASIGLTGQIFDIAGDPKTALMSAGLAAALLAVVARSSGAAIAAIVLIGFGDFAPPDSWWLLGAALAGTALAFLWRSRPMAHATAIALIPGLAKGLEHLIPSAFTLTWPSFLASALMALGAVAGRALAERGSREEGRVYYGWLAWGALAFFAAGSLDWRGVTALLVLHRIAWLLLSGGVIALGRADRHGGVVAAGVLSLIGAIAALMMDLGLELMTASLIFAIAAVVVLTVVWLMRGRRTS